MTPTRIGRRAVMAAIGCSFLPARGWTEPAAKISGPRPAQRELMADVLILQQAYEALHPGLYRYNTPAVMREGFDRLREELARVPDSPQWPVQAYLAYSRLAAQIRCGHTYANFYNQSRSMQQLVLEKPGRLPVEFRWLDGRMVVTRDLSEDSILPRGTEIEAVDGVRSDELLQQLMTYARADGANDAKRVAQLEVQGLDRYENFDVYAGLLLNLGTHVDLTVRPPTEPGSRSLRVATLTHAQRLALRKVADDDAHAGWRWSREAPGIARLTMPNWALYNSKWNWRQFIQEGFEDLAREPASALVIDLRGNEGGLDVGNEILPHLAERELAIEVPARLVRYRDVPDALNPYLDTWDNAFRHWGDDAQRINERFYTLRSDKEVAGQIHIVPRGPRFAGKVFVLIGPDNSSATFQFAQTVRASGLGRLVGRTTGGNLRGINGGAFFFVHLPASGIEMDLPLIGRFPKVEPADAGLVPDVEVSISKADLVLANDVEMHALRQLLKSTPSPT